MNSVELTVKDNVYLTIGKIVDALKSEVENTEEIWIKTNPLDVRFETTDRDGEKCRYALNLDKNTSIGFKVDCLNTYKQINDINEAIKSSISGIEDYFIQYENVNFRYTTMEYMVDIAKVKELAINLDVDLNTNTPQTKKRKM